MDVSDKAAESSPIPPASLALALSWVALLGGRWILGQPLLWLGLVSLQGLADLDRTVLQPLYVVLLAATLLTVGLRAVRPTPPAVPTPSVSDARTPEEEAVAP